MYVCALVGVLIKWFLCKYFKELFQMITPSIIANYATVTFSRWCSTEFKSSESWHCVTEQIGSPCLKGYLEQLDTKHEGTTIP